MTLRRASLMGLGLLLALLLALAVLWLVRARLVERYARSYFREHGIAASVEVGALGLSGASGRFALGPADAPELAAQKVELFFDPLRWTPYLVEVRLTNPLVRARVDAQGRVTLPALQAWLDSLGQNKEKSPYVSDDLAVSFTGLRALLATPGGAVEVTGDARLVKMRPVSAALTLKPGALRYRDIAARVTKGTLTLTGDGTHLAARLEGDVSQGGRRAEGAALGLDVSGLWIGADGGIAASTMRLVAGARTLAAAGVTLRDTGADIAVTGVRYAGGLLALDRITAQITNASAQEIETGLALDARLRDVTASAKGVTGAGDMAVKAMAALPEPLRRKVRALPLLAMEPRLRDAVVANMGSLALAAKAQGVWRDGKLEARLTAPLVLRGSRGGVLTVSALTLAGTPSHLEGALTARLAGGGLPATTLASRHLLFDGKALRADAGLRTKLDFAALHDLSLDLNGGVDYADGALRVTLSGCAPVTLGGLATLAQDAKAVLCPGDGPAFVLDRTGWRAQAQARAATAALPLGNAMLADGAAQIAFRNGQGTIRVTAARLTDRALPLRFNPMSGTGEITYDGAAWNGRFDARDGEGHVLGNVMFRHAMADGSGSARIAAPLVFAENGLQPVALSPLLAPFRHAAGRADFRGEIAWRDGGLAESHGGLTLTGFDFLTPLGRAHALDGTIALTSLLPPATAPGQGLTIARIDWTVPFSAVALRFALSPTSAQVERMETDIAQGHVALAPFAVTLATPAAASTATITSISLAPLIAASNLSGKAALEGKISGRVPFTFGAAGLRIRDGHITADGPGRLSISRSLWGENAAAANAVQDFAYQALEYLAFDSLTADINSVDGGRLQIVFHIKGRSDPPTRQVAEVAVSDIVNGTALQKHIPLPSGTPIDLTLDTSLNFDELLRSYGEAWSKALSGEDSGATP